MITLRLTPTLQYTQIGSSHNPPTKVVHCGWLRETNISAGSKTLFYQSAESDSVYGTASGYFSDSGSSLLFGKLAR